MLNKVFFLFILVFFKLQFVGAQTLDLVERSFSGVSKQNLPVEAKRDIQDQAIQKVSEELIIELIGETKFQKNRTSINSKIIKNSARYVPYIKPSDLSQKGNEYRMSVLIKISLQDLKQLLQAQALLNENDTAPVVMPFVSWLDRVEGRSYRWWLPSDKSQQGFFLKWGRLLENSLRTSFQKNNFYLIKPIEANLSQNIPLEFQKENAVTGEFAQFFGKYFEAPLLIDGQLIINRGEKGNNYRIDVRMTAVQVSNGRNIADVSRRFETEIGSLEAKVDKKLREVLDSTASDLASQVGEAWQRGSLDTSLIRLTIQGRNQIPVMELLKEKIRSQLTQVKNIHERLVTSENVSFEIDTSLSPSDLIVRIAAIDFEGNKLIAVSESVDEVVFKWTK